MKKVINTEIIKALEPCKDRFDNYTKHYGDKSFTLDEFISLVHISYSDKVWVLTRVANDDTKVVWAIDNAFRARNAANNATNAANAIHTINDATNAAAYYAVRTISAAYYAAHYAARTINAANAADATHTASATNDAAHYAARTISAANAADASNTSRQESLEILVYLINSEDNNE